MGRITDLTFLAAPESLADWRCVLAPVAVAAAGVLAALQMLVSTDGGDAHSADDCRQWPSAAGFEALDVRDLADPPGTILLARH